MEGGRQKSETQGERATCSICNDLGQSITLLPTMRICLVFHNIYRFPVNYVLPRAYFIFRFQTPIRSAPSH